MLFRSSRAVQVVTDAATELTGAAFGAFFYNVLDQKGESYMLYTLSGVPREAFAKFPMPRNTKVFAPTFGGEEGLLPLWWALSLGACLGGNGTLIGASANLTVAGLAERAGVPFRFMTYTLHAFPLMVMSVAISHVYLWLRYF